MIPLDFFIIELINPSLEILFCTIAFVAVIGSLVFTIDDLFIDFYALLHKLKPVRLTDKDLFNLHNKRQKKFAIIIANWQEDEILERMIVGNIGQIDYQNYKFF